MEEPFKFSNILKKDLSFQDRKTFNNYYFGQETMMNIFNQLKFLKNKKEASLKEQFKTLNKKFFTELRKYGRLCEDMKLLLQKLKQPQILVQIIRKDLIIFLKEVENKLLRN